MHYTDGAVKSELQSDAMLRDYQSESEANVFQAWGEGAQNVMMLSPTGGGKTVTFCDVVVKSDAPACIMAHRQELVGQAALALNRERVPHAIIAQPKVVKQIVKLEQDEHGYSCFNTRANVRVAGVDTIIRNDGNDRWFSQVGLVVPDEAHHVLKANKWGKAVGMFTNPHLRGLYPTAHAVRADGKGLGRDADGLVDRLILGPSPRTLMNRGFLTDYRLICVGSDIDFSECQIGPSGEFNYDAIRAATHKSKTIVGDVVKEYLKYAAGKLGITFVVDVEQAVKQRQAFHDAGVPAEIITGVTPIETRGAIMRKFKARQILQLISVDCLGEGVDVPAIEVVSLARRTASWQLLCQQVGRSWRVIVEGAYWQHWNQYSDAERVAIIAASAKPKAIIIDHVGNILYHAKLRGLPDSEQEYSLLRTGIGGGRKSDAIPMRVCIIGVDKFNQPAVGCFQPYERFYLACPHCGVTPTPPGRATPELVEGDLFELDPAIMAAMRGEVARVNGPLPNVAHMPAHIQRGIIRNHHDRYKAQQSLQRVMMVWGGWQCEHRKLNLREAHKLFFIRYGIDVMSAQTLNAAEAAGLETRIRLELEKHNVYEVAA